MKVKMSVAQRSPIFDAHCRAAGGKRGVCVRGMRPISVVAVTEGEREMVREREREDEEEEEREGRQYYLPLITTMSPPPGGAFMLSHPF